MRKIDALRWVLKRCIHYSKQDSSGVAPLKSDGRTLCDDCEKSNALNRQFHSSLFSAPNPQMLKFLSSEKASRAKWPGMQLTFPIQPTQSNAWNTGVEKLLISLNPYKAADPAQLKHIILQTLHARHAELAPILQMIFQKSLDSRKLPHIWKQANVSPIFKKKRQVKPCKLPPDITCMCFVQSARTHGHIHFE